MQSSPIPARIYDNRNERPRRILEINASVMGAEKDEECLVIPALPCSLAPTPQIINPSIQYIGIRGISVLIFLLRLASLFPPSTSPSSHGLGRTIHHCLALLVARQPPDPILFTSDGC